MWNETYVNILWINDAMREKDLFLAAKLHLFNVGNKG